MGWNQAELNDCQLQSTCLCLIIRAHHVSHLHLTLQLDHMLLHLLAVILKVLHITATSNTCSALNFSCSVSTVRAPSLGKPDKQSDGRGLLY